MSLFDLAFGNREDRLTALLERGKRLLIEGDPKKAIRTLEKAHRLDTRQKEPCRILYHVYFRLGQQYWSEGNYERAIENYNQAAKYRPNSKPVFFFYRAITYKDDKQYLKAIGDFSQVTRNNDSDALPYAIWAKFSRGICYQKMKEYNQAIKDFSYCIDRDKEKTNRHRYLFLRGQTHLLMGNPQAAFIDLEAANELHHSSSSITRLRDEAAAAVKELQSVKTNAPVLENPISRSAKPTTAQEERELKSDTCLHHTDTEAIPESNTFPGTLSHRHPINVTDSAPAADIDAMHDAEVENKSVLESISPTDREALLLNKWPDEVAPISAPELGGGTVQTEAPAMEEISIQETVATPVNAVASNSTESPQREKAPKFSAPQIPEQLSFQKTTEDPWAWAETMPEVIQRVETTERFAEKPAEKHDPTPLPPDEVKRELTTDNHAPVEIKPESAAEQANRYATKLIELTFQFETDPRALADHDFCTDYLLLVSKIREMDDEIKVNLANHLQPDQLKQMEEVENRAQQKLLNADFAPRILQFINQAQNIMTQFPNPSLNDWSEGMRLILKPLAETFLRMTRPEKFLVFLLMGYNKFLLFSDLVEEFDEYR